MRMIYVLLLCLFPYTLNAMHALQAKQKYVSQESVSSSTNQFKKEFENLPLDQRYLHLQQINAKLSKLSFENPNGPTPEWNTLKVKYDALKEIIRSTSSEAREEVRRKIDFIERVNGRGIRSIEYSIWVDTDFGNHNLTPKLFAHEETAKNSDEFDKIYTRAKELINQNKKSLSSRNDKGTEYYRFAQTYVNNMNASLLSTCAAYGTKSQAYGPNYTASSAYTALEQLAQPV